MILREGPSPPLDAVSVLRDLRLDGEAYFEDGSRARVVVAGGALESVELRRDRGLGIRVWQDGGVGFAFTTDLGVGAVRECASLASDAARHAGRDPAWRIPPPAPIRDLPFPIASPVAESTGMPWRIDAARAIDAVARSVDPRVRTTRQAVVLEIWGEVRLANTAGLACGYRFSRSLAWADAVATEDGASQTGHHVEFALAAREIDVDVVGREAARKALGKLAARPARSGRFTAVLDREVVASLIDALCPMFSARRLLKGTTPLAGRIDQRIAAPVVTLVDDPHLPGGYASAPVDGEGLPTRRISLIEGGVFRSFLFDVFSANKLGGGAGSTVRGSYSSLPSVAPMNPLLEPGTATRDDLVERAGDGVLILEVMGLHTVDPITGDFSLGGTGRRIERGRIGEPIEQMAFSGNLLSLLGSVEAVGSDLRLFPGGGGAPSLLLRDLSVAGPAG